jgi:hypothetical protein
MSEIWKMEFGTCYGLVSDSIFQHLAKDGEMLQTCSNMLRSLAGYPRSEIRDLRSRVSEPELTTGCKHWQLALAMPYIANNCALKVDDELPNTRGHLSATHVPYKTMSRGVATALKKVPHSFACSSWPRRLVLWSWMKMTTGSPTNELPWWSCQPRMRTNGHHLCHMGIQ